MEGDVFGRLLAIMLRERVDSEYYLTYPCSPVSPALCKVKREKNKLGKTTLSNKPKLQIKPSTPINIAEDIINRFFFLLHLYLTLPTTFEKLAKSLLLKNCYSFKLEMHFVFDRYLTPSIKYYKRKTS